MRDKVYGVLGLRAQGDSAFEQMGLLDPDYEKPSHHVFRDAVRYILLTEPNPLYILRTVHHRNEADICSDGHSSWVPRLDRKETPDVDPYPLADHSEIEVHSNVVFQNPESLDVSQGDTIIIHGRILDEFQRLTPVFDDETLSNTDRCRMAFQQVLNTVSDDDDLSSRLARTLIADSNVRQSRSCAQDLDGYGPFLERLGVSNGPMCHDNDDADEKVAKLSRYWPALVAALNRKVAVTQHGLLGLVPLVSTQGDQVVFFGHSPVPFVVRPCGPGYLFLGECYVDGIMSWQEERQKMLKRCGPLSEEVFHLH